MANVTVQRTAHLVRRTLEPIVRSLFLPVVFDDPILDKNAVEPDPVSLPSPSLSSSGSIGLYPLGRLLCGQGFEAFWAPRRSIVSKATATGAGHYVLFNLGGNYALLNYGCNRFGYFHSIEKGSHTASVAVGV